MKNWAEVLVYILMISIVILVFYKAFEYKEDMEQKTKYIQELVQGAREDISEKISENESMIAVALDKDYIFYLDGEDVTDRIDNMDLNLYNISYAKYEQKVIMLTRK
jgi:predicted ribosome quality control (RQC) complex YloA/Tae2 family protein